jgi:hypothetical protein
VDHEVEALPRSYHLFPCLPPLWLGAQCVQDGGPPADGAARKEAHAKARAELDKRIQVLRSEYEKLDAYADTPAAIVCLLEPTTP